MRTGNLTRPRIDMTDVQGLAMAPEKKHLSRDKSYEESIAADSLRAPCKQSCQVLVSQMGTDWKTVFDVEGLKTECK